MPKKLSIRVGFLDVRRQENISSHLLLSEKVRVGLRPLTCLECTRQSSSDMISPNHCNEEEGHHVGKVTPMSQWNTCCLYKVTEMIRPRSLVPACHQGVQGILRDFIDITLHVLQTTKNSASLDTRQRSPR